MAKFDVKTAQNRQNLHKNSSKTSFFTQKRFENRCVILDTIITIWLQYFWGVITKFSCLVYLFPTELAGIPEYGKSDVFIT